MKYIAITAALVALTGCQHTSAPPTSFTGAPGEVRLITLDPGHFHAALIQKSSYPQVDSLVYVYAPEGDDVLQHLQKIDLFNARAEDPTHWKEEVYLGPDFLEKMIAEKRGNVVMLAGNNLRKTQYIYRSLEAGLNVFADKPMVINSEGFKLLEACFTMAQQKGVMLYDIMTERFEITNTLQRELTQMPTLFGELEKGSREEPAVYKESVHHFAKEVAGKPLVRPNWFFDVEQQGEGIVDVNTHLVDLVQWACFPDVVLDYRKDVELLGASRWATPMSLTQYTGVTGEQRWPAFLQKDVIDDTLRCYCNGTIEYALKGVHAKVTVIWNYKAPEGTGDTHYSIIRGTKANIEIRQGAEEQFVPTVYLYPHGDAQAWYPSAKAEIEKLAKRYPGIALEEGVGGYYRMTIPASYHNGHEAHFGQVTENFLRYLVDGRLPAWEVPNMIAKYYITTQGLDLARKSGCVAGSGCCPNQK